MKRSKKYGLRLKDGLADSMKNNKNDKNTKRVFVCAFLIFYTFIAPMVMSIIIILFSLIICPDQIFNSVKIVSILYLTLCFIIGMIYRNSFHLIRINNIGICSKHYKISWDEIVTAGFIEVKLFEYSIIKTKCFTFLTVGDVSNKSFITANFHTGVLIPLNKKTREIILSYNDNTSPIVKLIS